MTKIKTILAALVLATAPGLALASGCSGMMGAHSETAQMSCAEGMTLNTDTNLCEPVTTG